MRWWTNKEVERLRELWSLPLSYAEIAREMGGGRSASAISAQVHRLGLIRHPHVVTRIQARRAVEGWRSRI